MTVVWLLPPGGDGGVKMFPEGGMALKLGGVADRGGGTYVG